MIETRDQKSGAALNQHVVRIGDPVQRFPQDMRHFFIEYQVKPNDRLDVQ